MKALPLPRKIAVGLVGLGLIGVAVWGVRGLRPSTGDAKSRPIRPIDAVPSDAFVAIEVDVGALRQSGALKALFGDREEQNLTSVCGFDPVDRMNDLVFTVPETGPGGGGGAGNGDFGVAVEANVSRDELVQCAAEIVKGHGGDSTSDVSTHGSYDLITPRSTSADATKPPRSLAYHAGEPILVGPKAWLASMIDALDAAKDGRGSPGAHATLRTGLAEGIRRDGPPPTFLLTATVLLAKDAREKLKAEMSAEVGPGNDSGSAMMLGILGMSSGVLGLYESGGDILARVNLRCEEEAQCREVERLIVKVRGEWAKMPELVAFGLGPVLDRLEVDHAGTKLELRAGAPTRDVVRWARLFLAMKPIVARPDSPPLTGTAGSSRPNGVPNASPSAIPTQTVKVVVPEGLAPGQPFTVRIPAPTGTSSGTVRTLTAVPGGGRPRADPASPVSPVSPPP